MVVKSKGESKQMNIQWKQQIGEDAGQPSTNCSTMAKSGDIFSILILIVDFDRVDPQETSVRAT